MFYTKNFDEQLFFGGERTDLVSERNYNHREMGLDKEHGNQLYVVFTTLDEPKKN